MRPPMNVCEKTLLQLISYSQFGVELHHHFSHIEVDIERYIKDGIRDRVFGNIMGYEIPMLPKLANGLRIVLWSCDFVRVRCKH